VVFRSRSGAGSIHAGLTFPRSCHGRPHDADWAALRGFADTRTCGFLSPCAPLDPRSPLDFLGRPHPCLPLPSCFLRDQPAMPGSRVSRVTIVATSRKSLLPSPLAVRRSSSLKRNRLWPKYSRSTGSPPEGNRSTATAVVHPAGHCD